MSGDYKVGYGKPPKKHRFKKGQSGNPRGRPKGTRNLKTDLAEELAERISLREGERALRVSKQRALLKSLMAKALKGDARAAALILALVQRLLSEDAAEGQAVELSTEDKAILTRFLARRPSRGDEEKGNA